MLKSSARPVIRLRGVRHNNLKNFDLDLPLNQLIVITGLSGSGKSSLAYDTLFAEGQRRYIETFSPYARQFFDRMDKPQVDSIEGIPPAIAIEQRNAVKSTRSTVGTMTEICDYMKMLWPHVAQLHCRQCGRPVRKDSPQAIWDTMTSEPPNTAELLVTFDLPLTDKLSLSESLALVAKQGYQRLLAHGQILRLEEALPRLTTQAPASLTVIQDRLSLASANRPRFVEACEQAYHFGKGKLAIQPLPVPQNGGADRTPPGRKRRFSNRLHCAECDLEYSEPSPALFSFNHPLGACPACRGFGRVISIDYDLVLPDRSRTLAEGVVKPWLSGTGAESQDDLMRVCRHFEIPTNVPFENLPKKWQDFVIEGEPGYGKDEEHSWPRAWYGVEGYFRWLESRAYKMHVRVLLSRYRAYTPCPQCHGQRFQPDTLLYRVDAPGSYNRHDEGPLAGRSVGLTLADFYQLSIRDALQFIQTVARQRRPAAGDPLGLILQEVRSRLEYLDQVGLGYLTLDRPTRSLSGGETERVSLTTCLGSRLVNTLFVLDEPSVGLHPRDTERLVRILEQLRDAGNTVAVVEHEPSVMRAADQIVDLGPGHGADGGQVVFQGTFADILKAKASLTGEYLSGQKQIAIPPRRPINRARPSHPGTPASAGSSRSADPPRSWILNDVPGPFAAPGTNANSRATSRALPSKPDAGASLFLTHAVRHNLKDLSVEIPLGRLVCVTGVSGSGKTTLVREVLLPALAADLNSGAPILKASDRLALADNGDKEEDDEAPGSAPSVSVRGAEHLGQVVLVDQALLGKTPRSNPAVYIGAFEDIREFFAQSEAARQRGLDASAFSFNSLHGQCERCRGAGFEKIEMQFLSDVFIRCPDCRGRRYRPHILEVKVTGGAIPQPVALGPGYLPAESPRRTRKKTAADTPVSTSASFSIADLLDSTIEEAIKFLNAFPDSRPARRASESLTLLAEVGLGYLKLGQPINTLSGGESQRLKLVRHLAEAVQTPHASNPSRAQVQKPTLFLFDEPTTGLHFEDVRVLLKVLQRLVDAGHSVLVIEHNLEVLKCADWLIDLGPEAGDGGGQIVAQGIPEDVAACPESHTGKALREVLNTPSSHRRPRSTPALVR
ncbi:UvrABC system protein A [Verrucomicrobia bacterium]|nr:UvrABC system protein A [Verrucomicrobiota bacterium]